MLFSRPERESNWNELTIQTLIQWDKGFHIDHHGALGTHEILATCTVTFNKMSLKTRQAENDGFCIDQCIFVVRFMVYSVRSLPVPKDHDFLHDCMYQDIRIYISVFDKVRIACFENGCKKFNAMVRVWKPLMLGYWRFSNMLDPFKRFLNV